MCFRITLKLIDYADEIYHPYDVVGFQNLANDLQRAHNSIIRFALRLKYCDSITPHRNRLGMLKLNSRRNLHVAALIYQCIHRLAAPYLNEILHLCANNTRQDGLIKVAKPSTNQDMLSLCVGGARFFNRLPVSIRNAESIENFSSELKALLFAEQCRDLIT